MNEVFIAGPYFFQVWLSCILIFLNLIMFAIVVIKTKLITKIGTKLEWLWENPAYIVAALLFIYIIGAVIFNVKWK